MRRHPLLSLLVLLLLCSGLALSSSLDDNDKKWLDEVRPIMLADEEKTFAALENEEDREEFRKIFWARRDPDLATPENEFRTAYKQTHLKADREFRVPGRPGSSTDCGRVYLLLGDPDDVRQQSETLSRDPLLPQGERRLRVTEVWVYRGERFKGGEADIAFDDECDAPSSLDPVFEQIAASKVVQPLLGYRTDERGHLVTLEDQLLEGSPEQVLLSSPRQDFPIEVDTSYLRAADGLTGVVGLVRGTVPDLPTETEDGRRFASVSICTRAVGPEGAEVSWTVQPVRADVQPDGSFMASYSTSLLPGEYTLSVGAVIGEESSRGSLVSQNVEVPDLSRVETAADGSTQKLPSAASILFIREIEDLSPDAPPDPEHPYAAFRLGSTQFIPLFGRERSPGDTVTFFYVVYDLQVEPDSQQADAVAAFSILHGGSPVARTPENPLKTSMAASSIGPVPLARYPPGSYVAQLKVTDRLSGRTVVRNEPFRIVATEASTP